MLAVLRLVLRGAPRAATSQVLMLAETSSNAFTAPVLVKKMVSTTAERMSAEITGVANTYKWHTERTEYLKSIHKIFQLSNQMGPCSGSQTEVTSVRWAR